MSVTITTKLDMRHGVVPRVIRVSQYDSDFTLVFELFASDGDFTIESGTTAAIRGTKPSGTGYSAAATVNAAEKTVTVTGDAQMTAVKGRCTYEITLYKGDKELNSANFILLVEDAALDRDTITDESVLRELGHFDEQVAAAEDAADRAEAVANTFDDVIAQIDDIEERIDDIGGLSEDAKVALLNCFRFVAWINGNGQAYYDALYDALYPDTGLARIAAVFTQGSAVIYDDVSLNTLKPYLTVTAYYNNGTSRRIFDYALSGTLEAGTSTITVLYNGKTTTFNVSVTARPAIVSIAAVFNQGTHAVHEEDALATLKPYLTVTATYSDTTTDVITDYTLSGTLSVGTSTITVSFAGFTTTFTVNVTSSEIYEYKLSNGTLSLVNGTVTTRDGRPTIILNSPQKVINVGSGEVPYKTVTTTSDTNPIDSNYYPVKIPSDATRVTVSVTPSSYYVGGNVRKYENGVFSNIASVSRSMGTAEGTFTADTDLYFTGVVRTENGDVLPTNVSEVMIVCS